MKAKSFKSLILISVSFIYILFSLIIFLGINYFYFNNLENEYIKDSENSRIIIRNIINLRISNLTKQAKILANQNALFNALVNDTIIDIPRHRMKFGKDENYKNIKIKVKKANIFYKRFYSNVLYSLIGGRFYYGELFLEIFDKDKKMISNLGGLKKDEKDSLEDNYISNA